MFTCAKKERHDIVPTLDYRKASHLIFMITCMDLIIDSEVLTVSGPSDTSERKNEDLQLSPSEKFKIKFY